MPLTFALADLHGRFDLLCMAYRRIDKHSRNGIVKIVHLGDYGDRGPQSRQIVEFLMDPKSCPEHWTRVILRGNHEDIMLACARSPDLFSRWWAPNGGVSTVISYGAVEGEKVSTALARIPDAHLEWLATLPRLHVDKYRVFVHAGVSSSLPLDQQDDEKMGWMMYPDGVEDGHGERHVVHGHHQHVEGPLRFSGRTNLDTLAWATGRLVIGVFDDAVPGGPIDLLEIQGDPDDRYRTDA